MRPISVESIDINKWWRGKDSNLRRNNPTDLQSAPFGRFGTSPQIILIYSTLLQQIVPPQEDSPTAKQSAPFSARGGLPAAGPLRYLAT
jgi:hypothetical protein